MRRLQTYAHTFNRLHSAISRSVHTHRWIQSYIHNSHNRLSNRLRITQHLILIRKSQRIGKHIDTHTHSMIVSTQCALRCGWIAFHLIPLQRCILRHLWRPGGRMQLLDQERALRAMQGEGGAAWAGASQGQCASHSGAQMPALVASEVVPTRRYASNT